MDLPRFSRADDPGVPPYYANAPTDSWARYINPDISYPYRDGRILYVLYELEGHSTRELATILGVARTTISKWLERAGIDTSKNDPRDTDANPFLEDPERLRRLHHDEGMTLSAIARLPDVEVSRHALANTCKTYGIQIRTKECRGMGGEREPNILTLEGTKDDDGEYGPTWDGKRYIQWRIGGEADPDGRTRMFGHQGAALVSNPDAKPADVFARNGNPVTHHSHHLDRSKFNNWPENIEVRTVKSHRREHGYFERIPHVWVYEGKLDATGAPGETLTVDDWIEIPFGGDGRPVNVTAGGEIVIPYDDWGRPLACPIKRPTRCK